VKLLKKGDVAGAKAYADHVIDQAVTILTAGHDIKCAFATPKLLEALALKLMDQGSSIAEAGITGIFAGGTEFTPQWYVWPVASPSIRRTITRSPITLRNHEPSSKS
jgi:hypothetical protein